MRLRVGCKPRTQYRTNRIHAGMARACVSALAARAGHTLQRGPDPVIGSSGLAPPFIRDREVPP